MSRDIDTITERAVAANRPASETTRIEQSRAVAEVEAAVVVAQRCPRDVTRAVADMRDACGRLALAERAFYSVPNRGSGPSVHLARELARIWGNVQYGIHELRRDDEARISEVLAWAWDVQTNTRSSRALIVPHQRMKSGRRQDLTELDDVYRNNSNIGSRAVRECIFTVLPDWLIADAEAACRETIRRGDGKSLPERIRAMVDVFRQLGVSEAQLEARIGSPSRQWDAANVADMSVVYRSIKSGETTVEDEFPAVVDDAAEVVETRRKPRPEPEPPADVDLETGEVLQPQKKGTLQVGRPAQAGGGGVS